MSPPLRYQVAFFTGQSDPAGCDLSPPQRLFLERLELPDRAAFPYNFPYRPGRPGRRTPILLASVHNTRAYFAARHPQFSRTYLPGVQALLARAERTIFLAGSCGLELLSGLRLEAADLERIRVFAYGPVARTVPPSRVVLVQGSRDPISRWWLREVDHRVDCGHLDYLSSPEVLHLCRAFIREVEREPETGSA